MGPLPPPPPDSVIVGLFGSQHTGGIKGRHLNVSMRIQGHHSSRTRPVPIDQKLETRPDIPRFPPGYILATGMDWH